MNHDLVTALGCLLLAGAGAFAAAVALTERDGVLGGIALVTVWLMLDDAMDVHDHLLPDLGIPREAVLAVDGLLVVAALVAWRPDDLAVRVAVLAFAAWIVLQLGDPYPMRSGIVELTKLGGFTAWSLAVGARAYSVALAAVVPMGSSRRRR